MTLGQNETPAGGLLRLSDRSVGAAEPRDEEGLLGSYHQGTLSARNSSGYGRPRVSSQTQPNSRTVPEDWPGNMSSNPPMGDK